MEITPKAQKKNRDSWRDDYDCALLFCTDRSCKKHRGKLPPGPLCFGCKLEITGFKRLCITCSKCGLIFHGTCQGINNGSIKRFTEEKRTWQCVKCSMGLPRQQWTRVELNKIAANRKEYMKKLHSFLNPDYKVKIHFS